MTPLSCDDMTALLEDILNGEVAVHVMAEVEVHLSRCPHCGGLVAECRATITFSRALPTCEEPLPSDAEARLRRKLGVGG